MSAFSADGKVVAVGDSVTIVGSGTVSGTGATATVTFTSLFNDNFTCKSANVVGPEPSSVAATNQPTGDMIGALGNGQYCIPGVVTVVTGNGNTAQLTITLNDGTSVTASSGACRSTSKQ